jgi:hypothetical protein
MGLRIENAYFREGSSRRELEDYLGTEVARYQASMTGDLVQIGPTQVVPNRPANQLRVDQLIPEAQRKVPHHRFFYQILINPTDTHRTAVLISAATPERLASLTELLLRDPSKLCSGDSTSCTVFPKSSSVSLEMEIFVNDSPKTVAWGSWLWTITGDTGSPKLFRLYKGRLTRVKFDPKDPGARGVPLLPGDHVKQRNL